MANDESLAATVAAALAIVLLRLTVTRKTVSAAARTDPAEVRAWPMTHR